MVDYNLNEEQSNGMLGTSQEQNLHDSFKYVLEENQQLKEDLQESLKVVSSLNTSQEELRNNWRNAIDEMIEKYEQATGEKFTTPQEFDDVKIEEIAECISYDLTDYDFESICRIEFDYYSDDGEATLKANIEVDRFDREQLVERIVKMAIKWIGGSNE